MCLPHGRQCSHPGRHERERLGKVLRLCGRRSREQEDGKETEDSEWRDVLRGDHIRGEG